MSLPAWNDVYPTPPPFSFRLLDSTWDPRFLEELRRHYTGSQGPPPGKKLAWEVLDGRRRTMGWFGLGEPAYKLAPRRRLGIEDARPLPGTACCFVYRRVLEDRRIRSSSVVRAWASLAVQAWLERYGQELVHMETLVDPSKVRSTVPGACFRRAGFRPLGYTTGRGARRPAGSSHGPRVWEDSCPKLVLYRGPLPRTTQQRRWYRNGGPR